MRAPSCRRMRTTSPIVTQTTLSIDDTADIVDVLKARFPAIVGPHKEDICYATTNRQEAVKLVAPLVEAMIVVGAPNSSNSQRLKEVAERAGCPHAALVQRAADIDWERFGAVTSLGVTAGASAPEVLVEEVLDAFAERYELDCRDHVGGRREHVLPAAARAAAHRSGGVIRGGLYRRFRRGSGGLPRRLRHRQAALLQGHCRGRARIPTFCCTPMPAISFSRFMRSGWPRRGSAVLSRADGASRRARHQLPAAGEDRDGNTLGQLCGRACRDRDLSRRHVDAARRRQTLRCGWRGAGETASRRQRFQGTARQCAVGRRAGGRCSKSCATASTACSPACADTIRDRTRCSGSDAGRAVCRKA